MKHFDAASTAAALGFGPLINAIRRMFVAGCEVPTRHSHSISYELTTLIMPAWQIGGYAGVKTVNVCSGNAVRGLPGLFSAYLLFDAVTGEPLAQIDGNEITSRRTAAASALAASYLAKSGARSLLTMGAGRVGRLLPDAYAEIRAIEEFLVWDLDPGAAQALVKKLRSDGRCASVVSDVGAAASRADIISCATLATEPLIFGSWLSPGSHLDLIGSFSPKMQEASSDCFRGADLWIDTPEALIKSGDLLRALESGAIVETDVRGTLKKLCADAVAAHSPGRRTVFKSVGTALEDLAAAILVYESNQLDASRGGSTVQG